VPMQGNGRWFSLAAIRISKERYALRQEALQAGFQSADALACKGEVAQDPLVGDDRVNHADLTRAVAIGKSIYISSGWARTRPNRKRRQVM